MSQLSLRVTTTLITQQVLTVFAVWCNHNPSTRKVSLPQFDLVLLYSHIEVVPVSKTNKTRVPSLRPTRFQASATCDITGHSFQRLPGFYGSAFITIHNTHFLPLCLCVCGHSYFQNSTNVAVCAEATSQTWDTQRRHTEKHKEATRGSTAQSIMQRARSIQQYSTEHSVWEKQLCVLLQ